MGNFNLQRAVAVTRAQVAIAQQQHSQVSSLMSSTNDGVVEDIATRVLAFMELRYVRIIACGTDAQGRFWAVAHQQLRYAIEHFSPR